jgi:hypothetical protein
MTWQTVPICDYCWEYEEGIKKPFRFKTLERVVEVCYRCGTITKSGIYVRRDVETRGAV